jgi:hypothetical protein
VDRAGHIERRGGVKKLRDQWNDAKRDFAPTPLEQDAINFIGWTIILGGAALAVIVAYLWYRYLR